MNNTKDKSTTIIMIISLSVLVLSLIPLLLVGRYAVPSADDFAYGYPAHLCWEDTHSFFKTLCATVDNVILSYHTWQGTFSSIFLMTLQPSVWSEQLYFLTPIIMLTSLIFSHFYLLYILLVKKLQVSKSLWVTLSSILCLLLIETVVSPVDSFYWFNGSVHYTFMHSIMLILVACVLHYPYITGKISKIILFLIATLSCVLCGGANYATALCGIVLLVSILVVSMIAREHSWHFQIPFIIIYSIAFLINVTADGNTVRQAYFVDVKRGALEAIVYSFLYCGYYGIQWLSIPVILICLLALPIIIKLVKKTTYTFPLPLLFLLFSIAINSCMYTPGNYSLGFPGPERLQNIGKYAFLLLMFLNEIYWTGYLVHRKNITFSFLQGKKLCCLVICLLLFLGLNFKISEGNKYSSYTACLELYSGEAAQYKTEYDTRLVHLMSDDKDVILDEFSVKPYLLYFDDISSNPNAWQNMAVANWYRKDSVVLK